MQLSDDFIQYTRQLFGGERFERFMQALDEELPVSIRLNPKRFSHAEYEALSSQLTRVPWCQNGFYLPTRPNFTFDPLLHAGCYYVQEASSMFLDEVLRQHLPSLTID
jgi:16S rRNA C967 or C1407 C5-methylase (RsmB/RsmF family)